jgi:hypothetical protein
MWRLLEFLIPAFIILVFMTEFVIPILTGRPLFGSFRKKKIMPHVNNDENEKPVDPTELEKDLASAKAKIQEVKQVQKKVTKHYKSAKDLKDDSDSLLKK